jgi:hypothetical protein
MAKAYKEGGSETQRVRDEEREVETRAAFAGKEMGGENATGDDGSDTLMPSTTRDESVEIAQRAADMAKEVGPLQGVSEGSDTDLY